MARQLFAYLQDVLEACNSIEDVMSGVSLEEYRSKRAVDLLSSESSSLLVKPLEGSMPLMSRCLFPYRILVRSLIFKTCLPMTMEQLTTMPFSDLFTQT